MKSRAANKPVGLILFAIFTSTSRIVFAGTEPLRVTRKVIRKK